MADRSQTWNRHNLVTVMESFKPQRSPGSDRFLSPFSRPDPSDGIGVEFDEDDVFLAGSQSPEPDHSSRSQPSPHNFSPDGISWSSSLSRSNGGGFRRMQERNFGVLAALPEEEKKVSLFQRKPSFSSASSATLSPSSPTSATRLIPAIPKPKQEYSFSVPGGKIIHQSAPMNVPVVPQRLKKSAGHLAEGERMGDEGDEEEMLPPHEIVARAHDRGSPMTTFSVLEGAGRTLKGRDLRRVRNAVWRQTGFLD